MACCPTPCLCRAHLCKGCQFCSWKLSPCGPLRRCYGGTVDQRAAPKTTMVKCTSDNCERTARKCLTVDAVLHLSIVPQGSAHGSSPCGPLRRCYGGIVDQRAAPKTTMVHNRTQPDTTGHNRTRRRLSIGSITARLGLDVMARRLDIPLDVETRCLDATDHCHRLDDHVDDP